jgi:hypothetical protein
MRIVLLIILFVLPAFSNAEKVEASTIILSVINSPTNDEFSCSRAISMSNGTLEQSACEEALPAVKESCAGAVNNFIGMYITTEEQARYVTRVVMLCQVWELLGYETITTEQGVHYIKKPGGVLP